jgi:hypothetical protein
LSLIIAMVGSLSSGHDGRHTFGGGPSGDWTPMNRCGDTPGANFISEKFLRINSHPTLFFYLSRIGKSFPKRVLIRKKPQANSMAAANALLSSSCLTSCLVHYTPTNYQLVGSWCVLSSFLTAPAVHQRGGASVRA